jgi:hypothetical protein
MDFTIHVPDEIGQKIKAQPDPNEFFVKAAQVALEDQMIARRLAKSSAQGRRGEYATDEAARIKQRQTDTTTENKTELPRSKHQIEKDVNSVYGRLGKGRRTDDILRTLRNT